MEAEGVAEGAADPLGEKQASGVVQAWHGRGKKAPPAPWQGQKHAVGFLSRAGDGFPFSGDKAIIYIILNYFS